MIWHAEKNFKENILNVFEVDTLQSHYEGNILVNNNAECQNSSNYCLICYGELNIAIKKEIKLCEKCDGIYHMTCICEVYISLFISVIFYYCIIPLYHNKLNKNRLIFLIHKIIFS